MIYLIHFERKVGKAQHYLGYCEDARLGARMREHVRGTAAALTREATKRGIGLLLARTFPGGSLDEEAIHKRHGRFHLMCPLCCPMLMHLQPLVYRLRDDREAAPDPVALLDHRTNLVHSNPP